MDPMEMEKRLDELFALWKRTSHKTPWEYVETDDGYLGVNMGAGHQLFIDLEGTCGACFANFEFIAKAHQFFADMLKYRGEI